MKLKLIEKREEAFNTKSFFWLPEEPVSYYPGQYFYFTLPKLNYNDDRGATRHFTISSSPVETRLLRFTTRMRETSGYKKTLDELPIGSIIEGKGPNGTFFFDEKNKNPHVFLIGGIGITTFRSMLNYNLVSNLNTPMYLLFSDSNTNEFTFMDELLEWDKSYDYFRMKTVTTTQEGRIDKEKIEEFIKDCKNNTLTPISLDNICWWVCGPPEFVDNMQSILDQLKINPDQIQSEKFTGY